MRSHLLPVVFCLAPATALAKPGHISVSSTAFKAGGDIPAEYTCAGADTSPPVQWSNVPGTTRSIALLVEDTEAPFVHWLVANLPSTSDGVLAGAGLPSGAMTGKNDKGTSGYAGPCPPSGKHHYRFRVFALDTSIERPASKADLFAAMRGHVLAEGDLVGVYERR